MAAIEQELGGLYNDFQALEKRDTNAPGASADIFYKATILAIKVEQLLSNKNISDLNQLAAKLLLTKLAALKSKIQKQTQNLRNELGYKIDVVEKFQALQEKVDAASTQLEIVKIMREVFQYYDQIEQQIEKVDEEDARALRVIRDASQDLLFELEKKAEITDSFNNLSDQLNELRKEFNRLKSDEDHVKLSEKISQHLVDIDEKISIADQDVRLLAIKKPLELLKTEAIQLLKQVHEEMGRQSVEEIAVEARSSLQSIVEAPKKKERTFLEELSNMVIGEDIIDDETKLKALLEKISAEIEKTSDTVIKAKLEEIKAEAQKKFDEKRTFAGYLFKPMSSGNLELVEKVIYISEDGVCHGIDPQGKPFENIKIDLESKVQAVQLKDPNVQRKILNKLSEEGLVSYSMQQDWEFFVLENLCAALNAAKEFITDRNDKFHAQLANVGIFYESEQYVLKLEEARNFKEYKDYLCDVTSLIEAAFDATAAEQRDAKLKELHAAQFYFPYESPKISLEKYPELEKAISDISLFQLKFKDKEQDALIEKDRKNLKEQNNDARTKFEKAEAEIADRKEQQEVLDKAIKFQDGYVKELTPSEEALRKEKEYNELSEELKGIPAKRTEFQSKIAEANQQQLKQLGKLLDELNDINEAHNAIYAGWRARKEIKEAIKAFVDTDERFRASPSIFVWLFRSSNYRELAESLESINQDLEKSAVTMKQIIGRLKSAISKFEPSGAEKAVLKKLSDTLANLPNDVQTSSTTIEDLLNQRNLAVQEQANTETKTQGSISDIHQAVQANDACLSKNLRELDEREKVLQGKLEKLKPDIEQLKKQREVEECERGKLVQLQELHTKSRAGRLLVATDMSVAKKVVEGIVEDSEIHRQAIEQRKQEMAALKESGVVQKMLKGTAAFFSANRLCVSFGEQPPIESLEQVKPLEMKS